MPWWSWVVIWVALVLALVALLVLGGLWLWRKLMRFFDDLGELADQASVLEGVDAEPPARVIPAVLRDIEDVRRQRAVRIAHRLERKRVRRVLRLERARNITSVDANAVRWPSAWYGDDDRRL
jgi:hypothetical protein